MSIDMTNVVDVSGYVITTVDERNPAPAGMYKTPVYWDFNYQPQLVNAGFRTNHQPTECLFFFNLGNVHP